MERRLFLTSNGLSNPTLKSEFSSLAGPRGELNSSLVCLISCTKPQSRSRKSNPTQGWFNSQRFSTQEINLANYPPGILERKLGKAGILWFLGGDIYFLHQQLDRLHLHDPIQECIDSGIIYGGNSAGSILATEDFSAVALHPQNKPSIQYQADCRGFGLIPFLPWPHFIEDNYQELILAEATELGTTANIVPIKDGEAIKVEGARFQVINKPESKPTAQERDLLTEIRFTITMVQKLANEYNNGTRVATNGELGMLTAQQRQLRTLIWQLKQPNAHRFQTSAWSMLAKSFELLVEIDKSVERR
ncbi:peptidase E [Patescibacteria group bacterium]|nr:peptidase E [Patescibacteria group bacterium]MCL5409316.1 peptidase E [Patescibacteria group bacterium]